MACNSGTYGGTAFAPATYTRLIELLDTDRTTLVQKLCDNSDSATTNVVVDCQFELLRQGGCGSGSLTLSKEFSDDIVETGMWVRISYANGTPWYLGRVEEVEAAEPSGQTLRLYGGISLLNDLPLGGLGINEDVRPPHLYAASDYFPADPDRQNQSWTVVANYTALVTAIYNEYIFPQTGFALDLIETPAVEVDFKSMVFRGEETISQVLRALAVTQYGASYGIDASGQFFFIQKKDNGLAQYQQGVHTTALNRNTDRSLLYNRLFLTGDYNYQEYDIFTQGLIDTIEKILNALEGAGAKPFRFLRAFVHQASVALYGPKTIHIHLPWIRTNQDAIAFAEEFFQKYAAPRQRYTFTTVPQGAVLNPWEGNVCLLDKDGAELVFDQFDRIEINFNEAPFFTITTGPEDLQYPAPPEPQRWELPQERTDDQSSQAPSASQFLSFTLSSAAPSSDATSTYGSSDAPSSDLRGSLPPSSDAPSSDVPSSGAPSSGAPSSNAPSANQTSSDAPSSGATSRGSDYPSSAAPSSDATSSGYPSSAAPSSDALSSAAPSSNDPSCNCIEIVQSVSCSGGQLTVQTISICATLCGD